MDIDILYAIQCFRQATGGMLDTLMGLLSDSAHGVIPAMLGFVIYWCVNKECGVYMTAVSGFGTLINGVLKSTFNVTRPYLRDSRLTPAQSDINGTGGTSSFPSGHAASAMACYGSLGIWYRKYKGIFTAMTVWVLLVCFSRLYLGVHTPQDVLVSLAIGIGLSIAFLPIMKAEAKHARVDWLILLAAAVMTAAAVIWFAFFKFPLSEDGTPVNTFSGAIRYPLSSFGTLAGLFLGRLLERRFICFDTDVNVSVKVGRAFAGCCLYLVVNGLCGWVLALAFTEKYLISSITSFICAFFAVAVCPALFMLFEKKKRKA